MGLDSGQQQSRCLQSLWLRADRPVVTPNNPLDFVCPFCRAAVGARCVRRATGRAATLHMDRVRLGKAPRAPEPAPKSNLGVVLLIILAVGVVGSLVYGMSTGIWTNNDYNQRVNHQSCQTLEYPDGSTEDVCTPTP